MSDDHIKSEISLYLSGGLTESRNRQIEAHAGSCDKCRNALTKARAKLSRMKREALKKASPDPLPNLFLARQGKDIGVKTPSSKVPWIFLGLFLLAGAGYRLYRHSLLGSRSPAIPAVDSETASVEVSSAPAKTPVAPAPPVAKPKPAIVLQLQQQWQGPDSAIKESRVVVVRKKESWDKLRGEMQETLPEVDFEQHILVGVFAGDQPNGSTVVFGKPSDLDEEVFIPYRINVAAVQVSTTAVPAPAPLPSHPYVLSFLPRMDKKIRLTQREAP